MPAPLAAILAREAESSASQADSSNNLNATPAQFVPILVIGILIILTVAGLFAYRAWKSRQMVSETAASRKERKLDAWYNGSDDTSSIEKPKKAALADDVEAYVGWVPQIHTWRGIRVEGIQLPSESNAGLARSGSLEKKKADFPSPQRQHSPPPTYVATNESPKHVPTALQGLPTIPLPIGDSDASVVSPQRTASMQPACANPSENQSTNEVTEDSLPLPRVMIVRNTFKPQLEDELPVVRGEAIRMLAEYKDGWCVVQRIGSYDSPKGVVPRLCLQEHQEARRL